MYKTFAAIAAVFAFLSLFSFVFFHVHDNKKYDKEINNAVKELVAQLFEVQYKTHDEKVIEKIFTEELQQNLEDYYPDFYREVPIYFISKSYMQTLSYWEEDGDWTVMVRIHEGLFDDGFWLEIGFLQKEDGTYVISSLAIDV